MPIKPLKIDSGLNLYDEYQRMRGTPEGDETCVDLMLETLHETFLKFQIKKENYREFGNLVLRFSMMMGLQDEPIQLDADVETKEGRAMHVLVNIYEHWNQLVEPKLKALEAAPDGVYRHGKRKQL